MSSTEEAIKLAMDSYEDEPLVNDALLEGDPEPEPVPEPEPADDDELEFKHMSYQEWIDDGNDPDDYRGKNAFDKFGKKNDQLKEVTDQLKIVSDATRGLQEQYQQQADERVSKAREEIQAEIEKARADDDVDAFEAARNKLDAVKPAQPQAPQETLNPSLTEFIRVNPVLDDRSPDFNQEVADNWVMTHNNTLDSLLGGDRTKQGTLTQAQIDSSMKRAMRLAKELSPERFKSPRNNRVAAPKSKPTRTASKTGGNYESRLKAIPSQSRNEQDSHPQLDMYHHIRDVMKNPEAANKYAADQLGDKK